jgi:hypothetical protein
VASRTSGIRPPAANDRSWGRKITLRVPTGSFGQPYLTMRLTGDLPASFRIEVSEVAPAFGQRDDGLHVPSFDADGQALTVEKLKSLTTRSPTFGL